MKDLDAQADEERRGKLLDDHDREKHRERMKQYYSALIKLKEDSCKQMKEKRKLDEINLRLYGELALKEKAERTFMIKTSKQVGLEKRKQFFSDKKFNLREEKVKKYLDESQLIDEQKKEFEKLSKEEDRILDIIDQIQEVQYEVFDQLGEATTISTGEALNKYQNTPTVYTQPQKSRFSSEVRISLNSTKMGTGMKQSSGLNSPGTEIKAPVKIDFFLSPQHQRRKEIAKIYLTNRSSKSKFEKFLK